MGNLQKSEVKDRGNSRPAIKASPEKKSRVIVKKMQVPDRSADSQDKQTPEKPAAAPADKPAAPPPVNTLNPEFSPVRETLRDIVYTAKTHMGLKKMKSAEPSVAADQPLIPQAMVEDSSLEMLLDRDWRTYYSRRLTGHGLEIGPLHRPMVRHEGMVIDYIDRLSVKELREHYPELNDLPLVEPNILGDAETLANIKDKTYDFVIAAHVIEHMKNPLSALEQWCRVLKPKGKVYLIVPDKRKTFDRNRVRTNIEHIIQDYRAPSAERDFDHFIDYAVHVHKKEGSEALAEAERLLKTDYSIHFHVFLPGDIVKLVRWFSENIRPVKLLKGPSMSPDSDEFHLLLQVY